MGGMENASQGTLTIIKNSYFIMSHARSFPPVNDSSVEMEFKGG